MKTLKLYKLKTNYENEMYKLFFEGTLYIDNQLDDYSITDYRYIIDKTLLFSYNIPIQELYICYHNIINIDDSMVFWIKQEIKEFITKNFIIKFKLPINHSII